jgi:phosphonoacetaldehyde dehydrogenase
MRTKTPAVSVGCLRRLSFSQSRPTIGGKEMSVPPFVRSHSYVAGRPVDSGRTLEIRHPYDGRPVGEVVCATRSDTDAALAAALAFTATPTRWERHQILDRTRQLLEAHRDDIARLITSEAGLCLRETRYETGRASDVLRFAAIEALRDDGRVYAGDVSPQGKSRKIITTREPVSAAVCITPFNHPLNQVAHKVAPAIAAGAPVILKPSEKTPLTALRFASLLYEAGLPPAMLSVLLGPTEEVAAPLVADPRVDLVSFTGSVAVGKRIAATAGYKRVVLELGGNDPLIVLDDADMNLAVTLAAEGSFRNSGQRCTAIKRILVHEKVADEFEARLAARAAEYTSGDPFDEATRVGTVIDEPAAVYLETVVREAVAAGARILYGGRRTGALLQPTVIANVPRDCRMVVCESFGPLAPVMRIRDIDDALELANGTEFGLSAGIVTRSVDSALQAARRLKCGMVNINDLPSYRTEMSPFGGVRNSGLGVKEGVEEATKLFTTVKTVSFPW